MRLHRHLLQSLLVLAVLAVGVGVAVWLVRTPPTPPRAPREDRGTLVEVSDVHTRNVPLTVQAQGTVLPSRQVVVRPEVTGRVQWLSEQLVPGGLFREGELMLRLDDRDYRLALRQQQAEVQRARTALKLEQARANVARHDLELLELEVDEEETRRLVLRQPQLRAAQDDLTAARSNLARAELSVARTRLEAPFNALVLKESVDEGQLVTPQTAMTTLVGTDTFWVQVSVPQERVPDIPGATMRVHGQGAPARIRQGLGDARVERTGRVVRLLGDLDPQGRMARLLVEIDDPLGLALPEGDGDSGQPLLLGAYVDVELEVGVREDVIPVPRQALRGSDTVYVMSEDGTLDMREVRVVWRGQEQVLVDEGLEDGEQVVLSRLPGAMEGMLLRVEPRGARGGRPAAARVKARR